MYDQLGPDYDRMVDWPARLKTELPFITGILREHKAHRILDAACGTGMHAVALSGEGFSIAGMDISPVMIGYARKNAADQGMNLDFRVGGFGATALTFAGEPPFDAILCLGNSLPHLEDASALAEALADFSSSLKPGGLLILQILNYDAIVRHRNRWLDPQSRSTTDGEYLFMRFYDFEPDGHLLFHILTLHRKPGDDWRQTEHHTRLWPQRKEDFETAFALSGFEVSKSFGSVDGSAFDPLNSPNLILIARRNDPPAKEES